MRKEITLSIQDRERALTFKIREMPATQGEAWIFRALLLLGKGSASVGETVINRVFSLFRSEDYVSAGIAFIQMLSGISYAEAKPLLDELLMCCTRTDAGIAQVCTPETVDGFIEDIRTLLRLRVEALKLNCSFFTDGSLSGFQPVGASQASQPKASKGIKISVASPAS